MGSCITCLSDDELYVRNYIPTENKYSKDIMDEKTQQYNRMGIPDIIRANLIRDGRWLGIKYDEFNKSVLSLRSLSENGNCPNNREALRDAKLNKISLDEAIVQYDKTMNEYTIWKNRWMRKSITFTEGMR